MKTIEMRLGDLNAATAKGIDGPVHLTLWGKPIGVFFPVSHVANLASGDRVHWAAAEACVLGLPKPREEWGVAVVDPATRASDVSFGYPRPAPKPVKRAAPDQRSRNPSKR